MSDWLLADDHLGWALLIALLVGVVIGMALVCAVSSMRHLIMLTAALIAVTAVLIVRLSVIR